MEDDDFEVEEFDLSFDVFRTRVQKNNFLPPLVVVGGPYGEVDQIVNDCKDVRLLGYGWTNNALTLYQQNVHVMANADAAVSSVSNAGLSIFVTSDVAETLQPSSFIPDDGYTPNMLDLQQQWDCESAGSELAAAIVVLNPLSLLLRLFPYGNIAAFGLPMLLVIGNVYLLYIMVGCLAFGAWTTVRTLPFDPVKTVVRCPNDDDDDDDEEEEEFELVDSTNYMKQMYLRGKVDVQTTTTPSNFYVTKEGKFSAKNVLVDLVREEVPVVWRGGPKKNK